MKTVLWGLACLSSAWAGEVAAAYAHTDINYTQACTNLSAGDPVDCVSAPGQVEASASATAGFLEQFVSAYALGDKYRADAWANASVDEMLVFPFTGDVTVTYGIDEAFAGDGWATVFPGAIEVSAGTRSVWLALGCGGLPGCRKHIVDTFTFGVAAGVPIEYQLLASVNDCCFFESSSLAIAASGITGAEIASPEPWMFPGVSLLLVVLGGFRMAIIGRPCKQPKWDIPAGELPLGRPATK